MGIDALDHYVIRGVTHNIPLLRDVLTENVFKSGVFTTNYLPETYPDGFQGLQLTAGDVAELASIAAVVHCKEQERARVRLNEKKVKAVSGPHGSVEVSDNFTLADTVMEAVVGDKTVVTQLIARDASGGLRIRYKGTALNVSVLPAAAAALKPIMPVKVPIDTSRTILSPMPGVVKSVTVAVGDQVGDGQECAVVEAMKMQNSLSSGVTGVVRAVHVKEGDTVDEDQILVEIE